MGEGKVEVVLVAEIWLLLVCNSLENLYWLLLLLLFPRLYGKEMTEVP